MGPPSILDVENHAHMMAALIQRHAVDALGFRDFDVRIVIGDTMRGGHSARQNPRCGTNEVRINAYDLVRFPVLGFNEYASFKGHVGGFATSSWRLWLDAVLCHEMAHVLQFEAWCQEDHPWIQSRDPLTFKSFGVWEVNHGSFFRAVYGDLRDTFINHTVDRWGCVPSEFDREDAQLAAPPPSPYDGLMIQLSKGEFEVVGRSPNPHKRLFKYQVKDSQGKRFSIKLKDVVGSSAEALSICQSDPLLIKELKDHLTALDNQKRGVERARETKKTG